MTLPPLANLFCVLDRDEARLAAIECALSAAGDLDVWSPAPGWIVGLAPLPGGPEESRGARAEGLAFCEGADRVLAGPSGLAPHAVARLARDAPGRLASLPGDFTFIAFGPGGDATAVRSCGGLVPIYRLAADGMLALGTRLDYFVRFLPSPPALDPFVNALWTTGWPMFPDGRTFLERVSIVDRGCYLRVRRGAVAGEHRYWDPRPGSSEQLAADPARPARLRELLLGSLARDLDRDGGNLLTLSGGVDSSALGALAAGTLARPLGALSFLPPDRATRARDEVYIDALASRFSFVPHRRVVLDMLKRIELLGRPSTSCFQIIHPALCILEEMDAECPVRVLVGGEYADEIVGTLANLPDWFSHTTLSRMVRGGRSTWPTESARDLLRWGKRRALHALRRPLLPFPSELPALVRPEHRAEWDEWLDRRRRAAAADRRPLRHLALTGELSGFVVMNWEAASVLGIRRSLPFFNREVLELAFSCHPSEQVGPGTKKLLRAALADDVPEKNLQRLDKGTGPHPSDSPFHWHGELDEQLGPIVREDWFPNPPTRVDPYDAIRLAQLAQIARNRRSAISTMAVQV